MWEYRAALVRVVDGDTLVLLIDQGFGGRQEESIRLLGVSAPERSQSGGDEAKLFVVNWCAWLPQVRWPLRVSTYPTGGAEPTERRSFVRYLGIVTDVGSRSLNEDVGKLLADHPEWGSGS